MDTITISRIGGRVMVDLGNGEVKVFLSPAKAAKRAYWLFQRAYHSQVREWHGVDPRAVALPGGPMSNATALEYAQQLFACACGLAAEGVGTGTDDTVHFRLSTPTPIGGCDGGPVTTRYRAGD